jgi:hypothetical protein
MTRALSRRAWADCLSQRRKGGEERANSILCAFAPLREVFSPQKKNQGNFREFKQPRRLQCELTTDTHVHIRSELFDNSFRRCMGPLFGTAPRPLCAPMATGLTQRSAPATHCVVLCRIMSRHSARDKIMRQNLTPIHHRVSRAPTRHSGRPPRRKSQEGELCRQKSRFAT